MSSRLDKNRIFSGMATEHTLKEVVTAVKAINLNVGDIILGDISVQSNDTTTHSKLDVTNSTIGTSNNKLDTINTTITNKHLSKTLDSVDISGQRVDISGQTLNVSNMITGFSTSALQTTGNDKLDTINTTITNKHLSKTLDSVDISGQRVDISGQRVDISGQTLNVSGSVSISNNSLVVDPINNSINEAQYDLIINGATLWADSLPAGNPFFADPNGREGWYYDNLSNILNKSNIYWYANPTSGDLQENDMTFSQLSGMYCIITNDYVEIPALSNPIMVVYSQPTGSNDIIPTFAHSSWAYSLSNTNVAKLRKGECVMLYTGATRPNVHINLPSYPLQLAATNGDALGSEVVAYMSVNTQGTTSKIGYLLQYTGYLNSSIGFNREYSFKNSKERLGEDNLSKLKFTGDNLKTVISNSFTLDTTTQSSNTKLDTIHTDLDGLTFDASSNLYVNVNAGSLTVDSVKIKASNGDNLTATTLITGKSGLDTASNIFGFDGSTRTAITCDSGGKMNVRSHNTDYLGNGITSTTTSISGEATNSLDTSSSLYVSNGNARTALTATGSSLNANITNTVPISGSISNSFTLDTTTQSSNTKLDTIHTDLDGLTFDASSNLNVNIAAGSLTVDSVKIKASNGDNLTATGTSLNTNITNFPTNTAKEAKQDIQIQELEKIVNKTGDIIAEIPYSQGSSVWTTTTPIPTENPNNSNGWLYTNTNTGNSMNLDYFNGNNETKTLSQVVGQYAVVSNLSTVLNNSLIFVVLTKGIPFTTSETHSPAVGVNMAAGAKYLLYWGAVPDDIYPNLPRLNFTSVMTNGPAIGTEEILSVALYTDSGATAGSVNILIENLGVVFSNGTNNQSRVYNLITNNTEYQSLRDIDDTLTDIKNKTNLLNSFGGLFPNSIQVGIANHDQRAYTYNGDGSSQISSTLNNVSNKMGLDVFVSNNNDINVNTGLNLSTLATETTLNDIKTNTNKINSDTTNTAAIQVQVKNSSIDTHNKVFHNDSWINLVGASNGHLIVNSSTQDGDGNDITSSTVNSKNGLDVFIINDTVKVDISGTVATTDISGYALLNTINQGVGYAYIEAVAVNNATIAGNGSATFGTWTRGQYRRTVFNYVDGNTANTDSISILSKDSLGNGIIIATFFPYVVAGIRQFSGILELSPFNTISVRNNSSSSISASTLKIFSA
jgi:hypothetical protein